MLKLPSGIRLRVDVADFLELEGCLQRHGVIQIPPDEIRVLQIGVPLGQLLQLGRLAQDPRHQIRQTDKRAEQPALIPVVNMS